MAMQFLGLSRKEGISQLGTEQKLLCNFLVYPAGISQLRTEQKLLCNFVVCPARFQ